MNKDELEKEIIKLRKEIETIDKEISLLFEKRMNLAKKIGEIKRELQIELFDKDREAYLLETNSKNIQNEKIKEYYQRLLECMLDLSKEYQRSGK